MVRLLLKPMGVDEVAFFQSEVNRLSIHFSDKGFDVVLVALVRELERLLDHLVNITLFIREVIDFTFHSYDWYFRVLLLISNHEQPPPELSCENDGCVIS